MKTETKTKNLFARAAMLLAVMMTTLGVQTARAQDVREGDWRYNYDSGSNILTITSYIGTDASITTPTMLGGHAVTAIGHDCFHHSNSVPCTSITVSEGVATIGKSAFQGCSNLASVSLPSSLTSIGEAAFHSCTALTSITIPNNVTEIAVYAFEDCGLTDLYFAGTKAQWNNVSVDKRAFYNISPTVHWFCTTTYDMQGHGTAPVKQTVYSGVANALTVPTAPTATGYEFGGWYRDAACAQAFDFTAALDDNVTVYAKWTALANTITFDLGGKGTTIDDETVMSGETLWRPHVQFVGETGSEEGIEGWYTDSERTQKYDFETVVDHSFTLYAKWAAAGHVTMNVTNNEHGTCRLYDEKGQIFAGQSENIKPIMPGNYRLRVKPDKGYSFSGSYTLSERGGTADMPYAIAGSATKTYALDLTEKDAVISVTFSSNPILTIAARADDASVLSQVTYSVVNNQTPSTTYNNGSTIPYDTSEMVAENFGIRLDVGLGSLSGYAFTATINDRGDGSTTYKNSNDGTSFKIVPHGSIDIDLYVYQPQSIALLDDGSNISDIIALNGDVASVTLKRAFTNGKKQTLCLPFAPSAILSLGKMYEFTDVSDGKAVMTERTSGLKANTPYIFEPTQDIDATGIAFENVTINYNADPKTVKSAKKFTFHGTYTQKTWEADEAVTANIYGFMMKDNDGQTAGQFVKARRKTILRPFSCWLEYTGTGDLTDTNPTSQAAARRTTRGEGETLPDVIDIVWVSALGSTTGIHAADAVTTQHNDAWYSLDGRRLSGEPSVKGVYINNGRKVVIK